MATVGRKSKTDWINLEEIQKLASNGLNQMEIATCLGVSQETWYKYRRLYPEIFEAYKRGRGLLAKAVLSKLTKAAMSGNIAALIFFAKTQLGRGIHNNCWQEDDVPLGNDLDEAMKNSSDNRKARIAELLTKRASKEQLDTEIVNLQTPEITN